MLFAVVSKAKVGDYGANVEGGEGLGVRRDAKLT